MRGAKAPMWARSDRIVEEIPQKNPDLHRDSSVGFAVSEQLFRFVAILSPFVPFPVYIAAL